jgi:ribonuclease HI
VCLLPISFSFLAFSSDALIGPFLAFNSAVWRFRNPAQASRLVQPRDWLVARIIDLANALLNSIKPAPSRKRKRPLSSLSCDDEAHYHNSLLDSATANTAMCYTDGSASPNPGPSGAAACIFLQNPDQVLDFGASLGKGTNNAAEICALTLLFNQLILLKNVRANLDSALVFTDSKLAISACLSTKAPASNRAAILELRSAHVKLTSLLRVDLHWIRGHSNYGGNERVDKVAKYCAASPASSRLSSFKEWTYGFPLYNCLPGCFIQDISSVARPCPEVVSLDSPQASLPAVPAPRRTPRLALSLD